MAICLFLGHSICNRNTPNAASIPLIAGILSGAAYEGGWVIVDKSPLEHRQSRPEWEERNSPLLNKDEIHCMSENHRVFLSSFAPRTSHGQAGEENP
jgi:hypothetical protein